MAEQELPLLSPDTQRYLQDYADGVNAYLKGRSNSHVSLEYDVLGRKVSQLQDRALDAGRLAVLAQGDGLGPEGQL